MFSKLRGVEMWVHVSITDKDISLPALVLESEIQIMSRIIGGKNERNKKIPGYHATGYYYF